MRSITLVAATAAILLASNAEAQRPDRGGAGGQSQEAQAERGPRDRGQRQRAPQLSLDQLKTAWEAQARTVASGLELDDAQIDAVVAAYAKARTSHRMANAALPDERPAQARGRDRERDPAADPADRAAEREARRAEAQRVATERREKMAKMLVEEREKLETELAMVLEGQKLRYATEVLGSFNPQWDRMTSALMGFELQPDVLTATMKLTENHVVETRNARDAAALGAEGAREAMQSSRERLLTGVKGLLTVEQYQAFERIVGAGQRGRGGPQADRGQRGERTAEAMIERMMQMDTDGDGKLSRDEVPERMAERFFDFMDENEDGFIDQDEMAAMAERRMQGGRGGPGGNRGGGNRGGGNGGGN